MQHGICMQLTQITQALHTGPWALPLVISEHKANSNSLALMNMTQTATTYTQKKKANAQEVVEVIPHLLLSTSPNLISFSTISQTGIDTGITELKLLTSYQHFSIICGVQVQFYAIYRFTRLSKMSGCTIVLLLHTPLVLSQIPFSLVMDINSILIHAQVSV